MVIRAYIRKSSRDSKGTDLEVGRIAAERQWKIAATYVENESGATLQRPELFRALIDCELGDILLIEQIDDLTHLTVNDWSHIRSEIKSREVLIVSLDLPVSWMMITADCDETQKLIFRAMNNMTLDILDAIALKSHETRKRRQQQGIATAKAAGGYRGRPENKKRNHAIIAMLKRGQTWENIRSTTKCSNSTIARLAKRLKSSDAEANSASKTEH